MREAVLVFVLCVLSLSVAQDCPLPTIAEIEGSVQYVCHTQESMINTFICVICVSVCVCVYQH